MVVHGGFKFVKAAGGLVVQRNNGNSEGLNVGREDGSLRPATACVRRRSSP